MHKEKVFGFAAARGDIDCEAIEAHTERLTRK